MHEQQTLRKSCEILTYFVVSFSPYPSLDRVHEFFVFWSIPSIPLPVVQFICRILFAHCVLLRVCEKCCFTKIFKLSKKLLIAETFSFLLNTNTLFKCFRGIKSILCSDDTRFQFTLVYLFTKKILVYALNFVLSYCKI